MPIYYELEPELETETIYVCSVEGCDSCCFDKEFADNMGCAKHGTVMLRVVRQYQNGRLISEWRQSTNN